MTLVQGSMSTTAGIRFFKRMGSAGFAHRRKPLASSLALAANQPAEIRERTRAALQEMGHPPDERAERLAPEEFSALASRLK